MEFSNENFRIVMNTETSPHLHRFSIVHNPENITPKIFTWPVCLRSRIAMAVS